ncbi:unnamed protein product [Blepharisma stoltei]|uniref:CRAL-TRIO domain-containing protein n=1 Tax=Blepharisma stoltei TaxID=1481888 RepID=A0AAU9I8R9_9CILI|nr:unnamed protein product [Blepharisma stoltei]
MEISETVKVPREAYRFWPSGEQIYYGKDKKMQRLIFDGVEFTPFEEQNLRQLEAEIQKAGIILPEGWKRSNTLRFFYGTDWKPKSAFKALTDHLEWRKEIMPNGYISLYPQLSDLLNSGCLYIHGRDHFFRPILIMNLTKFNFKQYSHHDYVVLICFLLEFMVQNMLLPGQIEAWVCFSDLGRKGLSDLPTSALKKVIKDLQDNFRCRLGVNYVINVPSGINFLWKCIKPFMDKVTVKKIKLTSDNAPKELFTHCNRNQVEQKYGGTAPNLTNYWPPMIPPGPYQSPSANYLDNRDSYFEHHPNVPQNIKSEVIEDPKPYDSEEEKVIRKKKNSKRKKVKEIEIPADNLEHKVQEDPILDVISQEKQKIVDEEVNNCEEEKIEVVEVKEKRKKSKRKKQESVEDVKMIDDIAIDLEIKDKETADNGEFISVQKKKEKLNAIIIEDIQNEPILTERLINGDMVIVENEGSHIGCSMFRTGGKCSQDSFCLVF